MPKTEAQVVESLKKYKLNIRDSIKEIEELMKKEVGHPNWGGDLVNKQQITAVRVHASEQNIGMETLQTWAENSIDILEELLTVCKNEKKKQEVEKELQRIALKGQTKKERKLKRLQETKMANPYRRENSQETGGEKEKMD
jgi:hypothetical protein